MKIFLLSRRVFPAPTETKSVLVSATDEEEARKFAAMKHGTEGKGIWFDPKRTTCRELGIANTDVDHGVILVNDGTYRDAIALAGA